MKLIETMNKALLLGLIKLSKGQAKLFEYVLFIYSDSVEWKKMEVIKSNTSKLWQAAMNGNKRKVKKLIPISDPKSDDSSALSWAARKGHTEIAKMLLPHSNPKDRNCYALYNAAENGHFEIVKMIVDEIGGGCKERYGLAMMCAANNGHKDCVRYMLKYSNMNLRNQMSPEGQALLDEIMVEESSIADARKNATDEQLKSKIDELDVVCDLLVRVLDINTVKSGSKDLAIEKINEVKRLNEEFKRYL